MSKTKPKLAKNSAEVSISPDMALVRQTISANSQYILDQILRRGGGSGFTNRMLDIDNACGYKQTLDFDDFFDAWDRQDIAKRCVEAYPDYTWAQSPEVYEDESADNVTAFEKDWEAHVQMNNPYAELKKLDILAGIGKYGVLVMGVNDGKTLSEPLTPYDGSKKRAIIYYRAYTEGEAQIVEWDTDENSVRFGLPIMYEITPNNGMSKTQVKGGDGETHGVVGVDPNANQYKVHYTRVIHFADNALCGHIYGRERLKQVYNRILDIRKIVGGSAEMFWQGAFSGIAFEMDADTEVSEADKQRMKTDIKNYIDKLQRTLLLQGVEAKPLSPSIADPVNHLDVQITLVSIATGIPKRVISGSEQGKLASTEDGKTWATRVHTRDINVAEPGLLRPYLQFCILNGIVSSPVNMYAIKILWPKLQMESDEERARASEYFTTSLETYCSKGLYHAMKFSDFLYYVQGYSSSEAIRLAKAFDKDAFEKMRKEALESKKGTEDTKTKTAKEKSESKASSVPK